MKLSDFSPQFGTLWAAGATSSTLQYPLLSGTALSTGRASIASGFPAANFTPPAAGGVYPWGADWNGALRTLSVSAQNYEAGNVPVWSAEMANNISGYPNCALVQYGGVYYVSMADGNITTPGDSNSKWKNLFEGYAQLDKYANFYSLSTTKTLPLDDNGNNVPSTYWVKKQGYALLSDIPSLSGYATEEWVENLGYVTGTTTTNVGVTNLEAVNFTGTDNSASLMRVKTPAGILDLPSETNVLVQLQSAITSGRWLNRSNNTPGFTTLPGGWILQSGTAYTASSGLVTIDFPITFPNMCIAAFPAEQDAAGTWFSGSPTVIGMTSRASNQVTMYGMAWNNGAWVARGNISAGWYAIGY